MKLIVLADDQYWTKREPYDLFVPASEATAGFRATYDAAWATLRNHFSRLGEEGKAWEMPEDVEQCRTLYACIYAEKMYTPELLPGVAAAIPHDGHPWCAELECYTDAGLAPRAAPTMLGDAVILEDVLYVNADDQALVAYAPKLGVTN